MPIPTTNTKIGTYSDVELIHWTVRERHKGSEIATLDNSQTILSPHISEQLVKSSRSHRASTSFSSHSTNQSMSFYDIINSTVGAASAQEIKNNLCLQPSQPHTCSSCELNLLTRDQNYDEDDTLLEPCGQCFLSSAVLFIEDFQGETKRGSNSDHQVEQHSIFSPNCCCSICLNCYSLCAEESSEPCLLDCDLQIEEVSNNSWQPWQEWSMLTRRSPTPSIGTKCPES